MVAHALSEAEFYQWMNESLVKLESQLQTVFNEFRSLQTAWETPQTQNSSPPSPPPVSVTASPVLAAKPIPISVPVPSPPPPVVSSMTPKQVSVTNQPPKKNFRRPTSNNHCSIPTPLTSKPVPASPQKATTTEPSSKPKPTPSLIQASMVSSGLRKVVYTSTTTEQVTQINGATPNRDWRPPWSYIKTAPNAAGRTEWRPPWCTVNDPA
ncbi:hypothetical protein HanRHA438_Chr11g0491831 [Helianthus annuus]|uniref:Uncharacterized protein n=1 Tax=Helianthus annuus TaxID=4232 RepID=A0A9K3HM51_HELAN|nr:proline-rich receptor-like protein kinase PERK8 [Helianthus annuus]KAF5781023.1 hypothetical protein HanXRQr2_Chr11g0478631 [Helianthus annuus]KAJ0508295.1 hypothetical protein HanIR_Chr11g0515631 [Helianthus annuus]KAJ0869687.1 hypothetical protein HanRHA438_Chr11g0491831 [Helianthus annuus]